jgi:chromosome segregation ATPase
MNCKKPALTILAFISLQAFIVTAAAQEPRPAQQKPPPAQVEKTEPEPVTQTSDESLQRAITRLTDQIGMLTVEVRKLRVENERTSQTIELLLYEERLAKVEVKIDDALDAKIQLDSREQEIMRRMRNIQQEVTLRGGLRREEAEASLRAEYQRALDDTRAQQANYQQRVAELQTQAERMRVRVEALRKKLERGEEKTEN